MIAQNPAEALAIGTVGPAHLLSAFALAETQGWRLDGVPVFHIWRADDRLIACERWICEVFGARVTGRLGDLKENLSRPLVPIGAADRLARRGFSGLRARLWIRKEVQRLHVSDREHVILPYRLSVEDALLAHTFRRRRVHYVADGLAAGFGDSLRLPARLSAWGVHNPFRPEHRPEIWGIDALLPAIRRHGRPREIPRRVWHRVLERVGDDPRFATAVDGRLGGLPSGGSCLLLQSFSEHCLMALEDELALYCEIIDTELSAGRKVVVKPHPRDEASKIAALRDRLPRDGTVEILDSGALPYLPIELILELLSPSRLIGVCSSALFTVPAHRQLDIILYDCPYLPADTRTRVLKAAQQRGLTVMAPSTSPVSQ